MRKVLIFGNSGSGKSTLAQSLCEREGLAHLDLDTLAWLPTTPPQRMPLADSRIAIEVFLADHDGWVIEGCYTDLLEIAAPHADEALFMDLPVAICIENARRRPWEPHKYESKAAQDENLEMLIQWIGQYSSRDDEFSEAAHRRFYDAFPGTRHRYTSNDREV